MRATASFENEGAPVLCEAPERPVQLDAKLELDRGESLTGVNLMITGRTKSLALYAEESADIVIRDAAPTTLFSFTLPAGESVLLPLTAAASELQATNNAADKQTVRAVVF